MNFVWWEILIFRQEHVNHNNEINYSKVDPGISLYSRGIIHMDDFYTGVRQGRLLCPNLFKDGFRITFT